MHNYRVSVTTLEKFRRWMVAGEDNSWDTEASLLETLAGTFEGNEKTRVGSAFHALIEHGKAEQVIHQGEEIFYLSEGHLFTEQQALMAFDYKAAHPGMFCELPCGKFYEMPYARFYVSGRVDGLEGRVVRDAKTKYSTPDAQSYIDSCQWKFYLDILGLKEFYFDVFEVKSWPKNGLNNTTIRTSEPSAAGEDLGGVDDGLVQVVDLCKPRIQEPLEVSCFAYPTMSRDLDDLVWQFGVYIQNRNLWHLLAPANQDGSYQKN